MSFIHSIKFRFTVWYLLVLAVLLVSLSVGVYVTLSHSLTGNLDRSLELRALELQGTRGMITSIRMGSFQGELGEVVLLYFRSGDELVRASARDIDISPGDQLVARALAGQEAFKTVRLASDQKIRLCAVPFSPDMPHMFPSPPGGSPAALIVGRSTADIDEALGRLIRTLILAVPLALLIAGGGGIFLANRALKPVDHIAQTALQIEESGNLSQRIQVGTKDELGRLASMLNRMIQRLEHAFNRQKEFTADASHELRAPLAVIQAEATLALKKERTPEAYRESLETISQEASQMAGLVDQLLLLARSDAGSESVNFEPIRLREILGEVASDAETLSRDKGVSFHRGPMEDLTVKGDRAKLKRLFLNLLDNAIRYTPGEGNVVVSLQREGDMVRVSVQDGGIGIEPEHIPHIFERFYRVDKARSRAGAGSGLGLAISKQIAEAHGGRIEVESNIGKGSTFFVFLPLWEPA